MDTLQPDAEGALEFYGRLLGRGFRGVTDDEVAHAGVRLARLPAASHGAFSDVVASAVGGRRAALLAVP